VAVAARAQQLEVAEFVAATIAERDTVMYLEAAVGAAANTDAVAFVDSAADLAPGPAVADRAMVGGDGSWLSYAVSPRDSA
jgi:hypothetical protein